MASRLITDLDPALQPIAQSFLDQCNADPVFVTAAAECFLSCTYRSNAEQAEDWQKGRDENGNVVDRQAIITDEPPGHSAHNFITAAGTPCARAFDFAIQLSAGKLDWSGTDPLWQRAISLGLALGLLSGSQWKTPVDRPHFEMKSWRQA